MRKKYAKIDLKFISEETNKIKLIIVYKIRARKRAQIILSNVYYPSSHTNYIIQVKYTSYIVQVILFKLYYTL